LRSGETATLQRRRFLTWSLLILFFGGLAGIRTTRVAAERSSSITVSAATSLKDSLDEAGHLDATRHLAAKVAFNYGGSGSLERQIEQGGPWTYFFSRSKTDGRPCHAGMGGDRDAAKPSCIPRLC
jgi:ABC-type molybdate transport system substrate-binding protein